MKMDLLELSKNAVSLALKKLIELDKKNIKNYLFSNEIPREIKAEADIIIEKILIDKLFLSGLSILSEESGLKKSKIDSNLRFIIDPIDGTVNFIRGISNCSISVALFEDNMPVFGVLGSYPNGVIAWGGKGIGAFIGETPIVDPIPVLPGFHEVSYLPPEETERVRDHIMFSDAVKRVYVPPGAVKQVFLYYQNQYSYLKAARAQARVVRYVGIAFIVFFMELIWLSI